MLSIHFCVIRRIIQFILSFIVHLALFISLFLDISSVFSYDKAKERLCVIAYASKE